MDFPCGGGCGLRSNIRSIFPTVGANCILFISCSCCCCWQDQLGKVGARLCVDFFIQVCWGEESGVVEK